MDGKPCLATREYEVNVLVDLVKQVKASVFFEVGTKFGDTTRHVACAMPNGKVFTLDLVDMVDGKNLGGNVIRLFGDSRSFDYTRFLDGVDVFFVDGDHSGNVVYSDSVNGLRCLREGGVLVWHDMDWNHLNNVSGVLNFCKRFGQHVHVIHGTSLGVCYVKK